MEKYSKFMRENGWHEDCTSTVLLWFKKYETKTRCFCNDDKPGIQLCVKGYDVSTLSMPSNALFEISITAEPADGVWIDFKCYSLADEELFEQLEQQITKLLCAWEAINSMAEVREVDHDR